MENLLELNVNSYHIRARDGGADACLHAAQMQQVARP
jgi:hypothetical protein